MASTSPIAAAAGPRTFIASRAGRLRWLERCPPEPTAAVAQGGLDQRRPPCPPLPTDPLGPVVSTAGGHRGGTAARSTGAAVKKAAGDQPGGGPQALEREAQGGLATHGASMATAPAASTGLRSTRTMGLTAGVVRLRWRRCLSSAARCSGSSAPLRADCGAPGCAAFALAWH